jgi:hypothetical protein
MPWTTQGAMGIAQLLQLIVTIILAALGFWLNGQQQSFNQSISQIEADLKLKQDERAAAESLEKLRFQLFAHVSASLEKKDNAAQQQQAAKALVVSLLRDDDLLRVGLLEALSAQAAPAVKQELEQVASQEREYRTQQDAVDNVVKALSRHPDAASAKTAKGYLVDVFYCANNADALKPRAQAVAAYLKSRAINIRIRPLVDTVNASPGMRVSGLQLRHNDDELQIAQDLRKLLAEGGQGDFALRQIKQYTPNYLSVFLCG